MVVILVMVLVDRSMVVMVVMVVVDRLMVMMVVVDRLMLVIW